ncbi:MAG TPA: NAD-dependent epimerase/dehydratase family protein, partial [Gammaproteobacteria bacterium]|nr:NAD-dependent epimerase/dehydratase family protein [Gammaproteobacteria bacterium]
MNIATPSKKIVVLGGTGFVGQHLCAALVQAGHRVRVLSRNPDKAKALTVLPTLSLKVANIYQQDTLNKACHGAEVLINLVGILNEDGHRGIGFRKAHVTLAQKVI